MAAHPQVPGFYFATHISKSWRGVVEIYSLEEFLDDLLDALVVRMPGCDDDFAFEEFTNWGPRLEEPSDATPTPIAKPRRAIVRLTMECLAKALNMPADVDVEAMQIDVASQSLLLRLRGPGLGETCQVNGIEGEVVPEARMIAETIALPDMLIQRIVRIG